MWVKRLKTTLPKSMRGSLTVEAAIIVPIILFCILWMVEAGITLYSETVELVQKQEMWEEFHPSSQFRKLELLEEVIGTLYSRQIFLPQV